MTSCSAYIERQSNALVLAQGRFVWPLHLLSAALFAGLLHADADRGPLFLWTGWMAVFAVCQAAICFRARYMWRRGEDFGRLPRAFDVSALLLAAGWGWLGFGLIPADRFDLQVFAGFVIGGAVLTGAGTHNLHYPAMAVSLSLILLLEAAGLVVDHGWLRGGLAGGMLIVFLAAMLGLGWSLRRVTRRSLRLQWEKADLARQLAEKAEAEQAARREAEAANAAKSRFLAQASHDLRQPIHSMGLFLAALPRETLPPSTREIVDRIGQSVEALSRLFNALLDVTMLDTGQTRPQFTRFALDELFGELAEEFAAAAETAAVTLRVEPNGLIVRSDILILRRILQNLIANALRHAACSEIRVTARSTNAGIRLEVSDDGLGIAEPDRSRIFDEFTRSRADGDGLGLGLFIVRRLTGALGVTVEVTSPAGEGACFTVGAFEAAETADPPDIPADDSFADMQPGRVLVVDDDRETRESTVAILTGWGWTVDAIADLPDDLAGGIERPALVIADYELAPGRTGLDVLAAIRAAHGDLPALLISGNSSVELQDRAHEAGLILLQKPVRPVQLRSAVLGVMG